MAHECPDCGRLCHCGGDVDDAMLNAFEDQDSCGHCPDDGPDEFLDDPDEVDEDDLEDEE